MRQKERKDRVSKREREREREREGEREREKKRERERETHSLDHTCFVQIRNIVFFFTCNASNFFYFPFPPPPKPRNETYKFSSFQ